MVTEKMFTLEFDVLILARREKICRKVLSIFAWFVGGVFSKQDVKQIQTIRENCSLCTDLPLYRIFLEAVESTAFEEIG